VGIRKTLGAHKSQLVKQFLTETVIISFVGLLVALVLVELSIPWFNKMTERQVEIDYLANNFYLFSIFGITLLVGIMAGSYPAFVLSAFKPVNVLRGGKTGAGKASRIRKILVISQFSVAVFMIIANVIFYQQIGFLKNKELGFNRDDVLVFSAPQDNSFTRQETIKNDLLTQPNVLNVSLASSEPGDGYNFGRFLPEGSMETDGMMLPTLAIDSDYLKTFEIKLLSGRNVSTDITSDTSSVVLVNETAVREFNWNDPVGKTIEWLNAAGGPQSRTVIGVVRDFHFESLHNPIRPLVIHYSPAWMSYYLVKVNAQSLNETADLLRDNWKVYEPARPTNFYLLDEDLKLEYRFEEIIGSMLIKFTIITIFIACLGLLGLASFTSAQRTREIGIRRVLGARIAGIMYLLSRDFLIYAFIANLIAAPIAYLLMSLWLQEFAFQVAIEIQVLAAIAVMSVMLSVLTVSFQSFRAARINPVDSLKHD